MKKYRVISLVILCFLYTIGGQAQIYFPITVPISGDTVIAGVTITKTETEISNNPDNTCGLNWFYAFGGTNIKCTFKFSIPVFAVRSHILLHVGSAMGISLNGIPYTITNANLIPFATSCTAYSTAMLASGGVMAAPSGYGSSTQFDAAPGYAIDSISFDMPTSYDVTLFDLAVMFNCTYGNLEATHDSVVCSGNTLHLHAINTGYGNGIYSWTGPNGFTSAQQNPVINNVQAAMAGTYAVTSLVDTCIFNASTTVVVTPMPAKPTASSNNGPLCTGTTLTLNATDATGNVNYSWTGPNGFIATLQNPTVNNLLLADSGYYTVTASLNGCSQKDSTHVATKAGPAVPTTTNNSPTCAGDTLKLSGIDTIAGVSYSWAGPNGYSNTGQQIIIPNAQTATVICN